MKPDEVIKSHELVEKGYRFLNDSRCRGKSCGAMIEWWETPNGKRIPLDKETLEAHFATCPDRRDFKNG